MQNKNQIRENLISSMERDCALLHKLIDDLCPETEVRQALKTAILCYSWLYVNDKRRCEFLESIGHLLTPLTEDQIKMVKRIQAEKKFPRN